MKNSYRSRVALAVVALWSGAVMLYASATCQQCATITDEQLIEDEIDSLRFPTPFVGYVHRTYSPALMRCQNPLTSSLECGSETTPTTIRVTRIVEVALNGEYTVLESNFIDVPFYQCNWGNQCGT